MNDTTPRPQWNHVAVKTEAARLVFDDVNTWAEAMGVLPEGIPVRETRAVVTLAIIESVDCYDAGRYLESFCDWPTNGELIRILDRAYIAMPKLTAPFVHAWVMEHNVRFPAKEGDTIFFKVGDAEIKGTCAAAIPREARGLVEVSTSKKAAVLPVNAEDIVRVIKAKAQPGSNPVPPVGGTPIAPRAGATLKKAVGA